MKTKITLLVALLISISSFAQQGINYKAIVKDGSGNVIANDLIVVQFTILETSSTGTIVYKELHTPTTDANGLVIVNIGEGTPLSGVYGDIDWGADIQFLKTEINTEGSLVDMGTTEFKAVPYALNAKNVTGLEGIDEGNGIGRRLIGRDPEKHGDLGMDALDLSISNLISTTHGATGQWAVAMGIETTASGLISTAFGDSSIASGIGSTAMGGLTTASAQGSTAIGVQTTASGVQSTAMGFGTTASGSNSTAMGFGTTALGTHSTAMGFLTNAESFVSTVIGRYNVGGGDAIEWVETDPLFEIGNGLNSNNKSNALTVFKNGNASLAGTLTQNSDRRLKSNITALQYGLNTILKLNPVSYNWKKYPEQKQQSLGLSTLR